MPILVQDEDVARPEAVMMTFAAQGVRTASLALLAQPDAAATTYSAQDADGSALGTAEATPTPALTGWWVGGEGLVVNATGDAITPEDYDRRGYSPMALHERAPLFPNDVIVLVTELKDLAGKEPYRIITAETF